MGVSRCVCHDLPFVRLLEVARAESLGFAALRERTGCSSGCTMCEPYVRRLLATGATDQPVMSAAEAERWREGREGEETKPGAS